MALHFEWDKKKAVANLGKHGVSFEEASSIFYDSLAFIFDDEEHSAEETREIIIGHSSTGRLLVASFTEKAVELVRLISARPATH